MRLVELPTELAVAAAATELLAATLRTRPRARVILPAGRTPRLLYAEILRRATRRELDLAEVRFFQLDEYVGCRPAEPRSFAAQLRRELLDPLGRAAEQDALLDGGARDPAAEIARHSRALRDAGGADLAFLGVGRNGHVAFNEPGTRLADGARIVELADATRAGAAAAFAPAAAPTRGITLGLAEIAAAKQIALLATGSSKRAIVAALLGEPPSPARPASLLLDHRDFTLLVDAEASAEARGGTGR